MRGVTVLGSTGTIGINTLDVLARNTQAFRVVALTAASNVDLLAEQCTRFRPQYAVLAGADREIELRERLAHAHLDTQVLAGSEALQHVASLPEVDCVMAGIVGAAGLLPTLNAVRAGKHVLLANKESLVMAGSLLMREAVRSGAVLLPVDSEHNALFQCMPPGFDGNWSLGGVAGILLTASGGPFRDLPLERLDSVSPDEACAHPNWDMGRKISVDSATMMNKGLEVIEARWLFDAQLDSIEVVLHRESVVHSMVRYVDGSVLAQLGHPDMRTPIAHALAWPKRLPSGVEPLDFAGLGRLSFEPIEAGRFPCLELAYQALRMGGDASIVLNAANEVAVDAFLAGRIRFTAIAGIIETTLAKQQGAAPDDLDAILAVDEVARAHARETLARYTEATA